MIRLVASGIAGLGLGLGACVAANPDHCLHKAADDNAWCAEKYSDRAFCSPCAGEYHGCVKTEPSESACPAYEPPPADASSGSESDSASGSSDSTDSTAESSESGSTDSTTTGN